MSTTPSPLVAYRHLLRATRVAFWGDWPRMHAAREFARQRFDAEKAATEGIEAKIQEAEDAARILRTELIQGEEVGDKRYRLRIHDEIERGDNDTVKIGGQSVKVDKCCS
ncbi:Mitochondrial zinc maintenance protein 1, mitochondrial [Ascosphaera pollenicola]|nr:Mitochondrial zinc maintenance protein 1, mitochondrial [Ascosphaera pollenicola]